MLLMLFFLLLLLLLLLLSHKPISIGGQHEIYARTSLFHWY
jgi:hypothetical protein